MDFQSSLSTYLVRPRVAKQRRRTVGWRTQLQLIARTHPKLLSNLILVLAAWGGLSFSYNYLTDNRSLTGQSAYAGVMAGTGAPKLNTANLAEARVAALPGGPSGLLLPPGSMAPDRTYANSYARGQCTWYVAGRRPLPRNWGNAKSWYYHALNSGYKVGTAPAIAAIAWTSAGYYGHVALVEQVSADNKRVLISEMNYRGVGVKSTRWVAASAFKYIY